MLYGDEKKREMLRSILPSKASKDARTKKKHANRQNRRRAKKAIDTWAEEDESRCSMLLHVSERLKDRDIAWMKRDRRDADKLNHFVRWAESVTSHIPKENVRERYDYFLGYIGGAKDLIRKHAVSHFISDWQLNPARSWWLRGDRPKLEKDIELKKWERLVREAFEHDHKGLNRELKKVCLVKRSCSHKDPCMTRHTRFFPFTHDVSNCANILLMSGAKDVEAVAESIYYGKAKGFVYSARSCLHSHMTKYFKSRGYNV